MEPHISDITRVIQLAVAPVFLLTAIATLIATLNNRLGRIVDRRRVLMDRLLMAGNEQSAEQAQELELLARRVRLTYQAILGAVLAGLLVCLVVAGAFIGALVSVDISKAVATLFVLAMLALVAALGLFLREVFIAVSRATQLNR
jgi:hypothetical protein